MVDHKPPRTVGDEVDTAVTFLRYCRESFLRKLEGLDGSQLTASPVPTGTSLLGLLRHLVRAERSWVLERFAGQPVDGDDPESWDLEEATRRYRATWNEVDDVVRRSSFDQLAVAESIAPPVSLRWIVTHLIDETARHAGHADIIRELIDGATGR